jgi:hypothetical protein
MKTLKFKYNIHLSPKFGGIDHGEKIGADAIKRDAVHEIESDELADHMVKEGLAEEVLTDKKPMAKKEKTGGAGGAAAAVMAFLLLLCGMSAHADIYSYKAVQFTNAVSGPLSTNGQIILAANQVLTVNSDPIALGAKRGVGLWHLLQCSGAGTGISTNTFDVATVMNGTTNWTTTHPISLQTTANGTTLVINWQNVSAMTVDNASLIRWATSANGATQSTNSMWGSYSLYAP